MHRWQALLKQVRTGGSWQDRPIHSLSGGQKQRLAIASEHWLSGAGNCCCSMSPPPCWTPRARQSVLTNVQSAVQRLRQLR